MSLNARECAVNNQPCRGAQFKGWVLLLERRTSGTNSPPSPPHPECPKQMPSLRMVHTHTHTHTGSLRMASAGGGISRLISLACWIWTPQKINKAQAVNEGKWCVCVCVCVCSKTKESCSMRCKLVINS